MRNEWFEQNGWRSYAVEDLDVYSLLVTLDI